MKYDFNEAIMEYLHAASRGKLCVVHDSEEAIAAQKVLLSKFPEDLSNPDVYHRILRDICLEKDSDNLDDMLILARAFKLFDPDTIALLSQISCDDWHSMAEQLVEIFEAHPVGNTADILFRMSLARYPNQYYSDDNNGIVARKAVWALWRMDEIDTIRQIAESSDEIAAGYAKRQLRRLD